ncbi:hypothetical protein ARSEF4850_004743 [Beauveria asiatica]
MPSLSKLFGLSATGGGDPQFMIAEYLMANILISHTISSTRGLKWLWRIDLEKSGPRAVLEGRLRQSQLDMLWRNEAAHANSMEHFPVFAAALILAKMAGVSAADINYVGLTYTLARIAFVGNYITTKLKLAALGSSFACHDESGFSIQVSGMRITPSMMACATCTPWGANSSARARTRARSECLDTAKGCSQALALTAAVAPVYNSVGTTAPPVALSRSGSVRAAPAAAAADAPFLEQPTAEFRAATTTQIASAYAFSQAVMPLLTYGGGHAEFPATLAFVGCAGASRSDKIVENALVALSRSLGREYGKKYIHVAHVKFNKGAVAERSKTPNVMGADGGARVAETLWHRYTQPLNCFANELVI